MAELLDRARQLVAAGPYDARVSELIAVHALVYPQREPVCDHCPAEQGKAFYAIRRWVEQQEAAADLGPNSSAPMEKTAVTARLKEGIIYTPHGLGVAYSNANLTEKAALDILTADPEAAKFFDALPESYSPAQPEGEEDADDKPKALSRMNSADLRATHLAELGTEAAEDATNDQVRDAIKAHRAANPTT